MYYLHSRSVNDRRQSLKVTLFKLNDSATCACLAGMTKHITGRTGLTGAIVDITGR